MISGSFQQVAPSRPGAHGLYFPNLKDAGGLLNEAPEHWVEWQIGLALGSATPTEFINSSRARIRCEPAGWADIDRSRRLTTLHLPTEPTAEHLAQPFLGSTAVVAAHWRGLHCFHAGAFVADGRAWAILGSKGAGKSSLLAGLHLLGLQILSDDLLVVSEGLAGLAGPRAIDLRSEAASALRIGVPLGEVGARERWRVQLDRVEPEIPLGGWVSLDWGNSTIGSVDLARRIEALQGSLALRVRPRDQVEISRLMDLMALPMCRIWRPRGLSKIAETAKRLAAHLTGL